MTSNVLCALTFFSAAASSAEVLAVPEAFVGTWASSRSGCASGGPGVLRITMSSIELEGLSGRLNAVTATGVKSIEVLFERTGGGVTSRQVRTYALDPSGEKLRETRFGSLVATRVRCAGKKS